MGKKNGNESKELVRVTSEFAIIKMDQQTIQETVTDNLGSSGISAFTLPRVKIPAGGAQSWEMPTLGEDEPSSTRSFDAVPVLFHGARRFYAKKLKDRTKDDNPMPDCWSRDGITGCGNFGTGHEDHRNCLGCSMNQWGSARDEGKGKACAEQRYLYLLRKDDVLPVLLILAPSSLKAHGLFNVKLSQKAIPYWQALTRFSLASVPDGPSGPYSTVTMSFVERVDAKDHQRLREYQKSLKAFVATMDFEDAEGSAPVDAEVEAGAEGHPLG